MNLKQKGTTYERELVHMLWSKGFACIRCAGSGSIKYPTPDILAGNNIRKLGIECKSSASDTLYVPFERIAALQEFCTMFGAEPWIAVRFSREPWYFLNIEDLHKTEKNFILNLSRAKSVGLLFEEVIK